MHLHIKRLGLGTAALALVLFLGVSCKSQITPATNKAQPTPPASSGVNVNVNTNTAPTNSVTPPVDSNPPASSDNTIPVANVREFSMTSFYELVDGQSKPQFSSKEITVKKGDKVRIKVTNTKGIHDFNIDEYNIRQATPLDQPVTIEFTADKVGEFVYYCSTPNHRALGQWGTLKVQE